MDATDKNEKQNDDTSGAGSSIQYHHNENSSSKSTERLLSASELGPAQGHRSKRETHDLPAQSTHLPIGQSNVYTEVSAIEHDIATTRVERNAATGGRNKMLEVSTLEPRQANDVYKETLDSSSEKIVRRKEKTCALMVLKEHPWKNESRHGQQDQRSGEATRRHMSFSLRRLMHQKRHLPHLETMKAFVKDRRRCVRRNHSLRFPEQRGTPHKPREAPSPRSWRLCSCSSMKTEPWCATNQFPSTWPRLDCWMKSLAMQLRQGLHPATAILSLTRARTWLFAVCQRTSWTP